MGRQVGVSTFLITLAAWEGSRGKSVIHISANEHKRQIAAGKLWSDRNGYGYKGVWLGILHLHGGEDSKNHDIVLYDNEYDIELECKSESNKYIDDLNRIFA